VDKNPGSTNTEFGQLIIGKSLKYCQRMSHFDAKTHLVSVRSYSFVRLSADNRINEQTDMCVCSSDRVCFTHTPAINIGLRTTTTAIFTM